MPFSTKKYGQFVIAAQNYIYMVWVLIRNTGDSHDISGLIFFKKKKKKNQNVGCNCDWYLVVNFQVSVLVIIL